MDARRPLLSCSGENDEIMRGPDAADSGTRSTPSPPSLAKMGRAPDSRPLRPLGAAVWRSSRGTEGSSARWAPLSRSAPDRGETDGPAVVKSSQLGQDAGGGKIVRDASVSGTDGRLLRRGRVADGAGTEGAGTEGASESPGNPGVR